MIFIILDIPNFNYSQQQNKINLTELGNSPTRTMQCYSNDRLGEKIPTRIFLSDPTIWKEKARLCVF
jgi:hypothetical protein